MSLETRELHPIANGARWRLVRGGRGPEHQELLRLIGTLVEGGPSGA